MEILRLDCGLDEKLNFCAYSPPHISCYTTSPALFIGATNFGHLRTPTPENCQISERKVTKKSPKVNPGNQLYREPSCPARVILPWMLSVIFMPIHAHILWNHVESWHYTSAIRPPPAASRKYHAQDPSECLAMDLKVFHHHRLVHSKCFRKDVGDLADTKWNMMQALTDTNSYSYYSVFISILLHTIDL